MKEDFDLFVAYVLGIIIGFCLLKLAVCIIRSAVSKTIKDHFEYKYNYFKRTKKYLEKVNNKEEGKENGVN